MIAEIKRAPNGEEALRPRWGEETLERIAGVYEAERAKHSAYTIAAWAELPVEARIVLIGVYCAGRVDGAECERGVRCR